MLQVFGRYLWRSLRAGTYEVRITRRWEQMEELFIDIVER
jgi:hypothetical protein